MRYRVTTKQPNSKMCFVCGLKNSFGLKARFFEIEDGRLISLFKPSEEHQGYPGRLHGGIVATILDETIGRAIMNSHFENIWGVTLDFEMKLRKPVPLNEELRVVSKIVSESKRGFVGEGQLLLPNGQVGVEGRGKYLKMDIDKIADFDHDVQEWRVVEESTDPDYISL